MPGELSTILIRLEGVLVDADDGRPRPFLRAFFKELRKFRDIRVISEWPADQAERELRSLENEGHIPRARRKRGALQLLVYAENARPPLTTFGPPDRVVLIDAFPPRSDEDAQWTIRAPRIPAGLSNVMRALRWRAGVPEYQLMTSNTTLPTLEIAGIIDSDPAILSGTPMFVGTQVPVRNLFDRLAAGDSLERFLETFPSVTREQAVAALDLVLQLRVISARAVVGAARDRLVVAPPARVRNHVVRIGWDLLEDETGEQMLNLRDAQVDARRAGLRPFFRGDCRARIAARNACA